MPFCNFHDKNITQESQAERAQTSSLLLTPTPGLKAIPIPALPVTTGKMWRAQQAGSPLGQPVCVCQDPGTGGL